MPGTPTGLFAASPTSPSWRPALATVDDPDLLDDLLRRAAAAAAAPSVAVSATWHIEKHAWFVAYGALLSLLRDGTLPDLRAVLVHDADEGWIDDVSVPPGSAPGDGPALARALEAHLRPLVEVLAAHRPRRALWRCAGDRLAQAATWAGEPALPIAAAALAAPTALQAPCEFTVVDGEPFRRRTGCCLSYRCEGTEQCADCVLGARQRTARTSARSCS